MNNRVQIYTDGACSNNQERENRGGYGVVIIQPNSQPIEFSGGYLNTTNNRMELKAVIEALKVVSTNTPVTVYSDSQYVIRGINEWIFDWIRKGKIAKNSDLWLELYNLRNTFTDIIFTQIKGYNGDLYNTMADDLATRGCTYCNLPIDNDGIRGRA